MNWVSSSLQLAGTLLESVDQHAAMTLAGDAAEDDLGLLSTITHKIRGDESDYDGSERKEERAQGDKEADSEEADVAASDSTLSRSGDSPLKTTTSKKLSERVPDDPARATPTPPHSGSGTKLSGFVSAISTQLENVSSSRSDASSSTPKHADSDEDYSGLRKEISRVKVELRTKEKQLASSQRSLQICEEEIDALERECKEKLAQMQHEMAVLRQEKDTDEQNFMQALGLKDTQIRAMKDELATFSASTTLQSEQIASLKAELAKTVESKDSLWTTAASASNESEQLIHALRAELQETLGAMTALKREHADAKLAMYTRQSQLENANAELVNSVANLERALEKAKEAAVATTPFGTQPGGLAVNGLHHGGPSGFSSMSSDYRRVQQTLVLTKKSLHDETRKNEIQKQEILTLTDEVRRLKQTLEASQEASAREIFSARQENEQLKEQLSQASSHHSVSGIAESEARIQRLTNRLIEKQESIGALRSKVTTLEVRLQDAQFRAQSAEEKLARIERNGGAFDDSDMGAPVGKRGGGHLRARTSNRMASMLSRVAPVMERSHRVVSALDVLDRWLLFLGRVFLQMPVARLALLCYILLIHGWVFVILGFHTSHLNEEMHAGAAGHAGGVATDVEQALAGRGGI